MALTTKSAWALMDGGSGRKHKETRMDIVATRKFWMNGTLQPIGARLNVPEHEARALITAGKAEAAESAAPPAPAPTSELKENENHASTPTEIDPAESSENVQGVD